MPSVPFRLPILIALSCLAGCASLPPGTGGQILESLETPGGPRLVLPPPAETAESSNEPVAGQDNTSALASSSSKNDSIQAPFAPIETSISLRDPRPVWLMPPELIDRRTNPLLDLGLANLLDSPALVSNQISGYRIASSDRGDEPGNEKDDDDEDKGKDEGKDGSKEAAPENPGQSAGSPGNAPLNTFSSIVLELDGLEVLRKADLDDADREDRSDEDRETDDREPDEASDDNPRADGRERAPRGWIPLQLATGSLDLLHLDRGELPLGETALPSGRYAAIRFTGRGHYTGTTKQGIAQSGPFVLTGGQLKIPVEFRLRDGKSTSIRLRLDARKALIVTPSETRLRPGALRARVRSKSAD